MIFARLTGGLGNQMFQYAAARAVALRCGSEVMLDTRDLGRGVAHSVFGLEHFCIAARVGRVAELPPGRSHIFRHALWRVFGTKPVFMRERGLGLNRAVLSAGDGVYLHGYWQSEGYFADVADQIRADFAFSTGPTADTARILERIGLSDEAVSIHLRRGDYVSTSGGRGAHGVCDEAYYRRALRRVRSETGKALHAFVFSDDPAWAKDHLHLDCAMTHVDVNGPLASHDDLRLMAACRHHVIANSTFSWWGAWLDPRPDKVVVAPERWFADPRLCNPDILPQAWIAA